MGKLDRIDTGWTAEAFLRDDMHDFGEAWRYELVDGVVIAHAAPAPLHGEILAKLTGAVLARMRGKPCKTEVGTGAVPRGQQRPTARIPDLLIRCGKHPQVIFEVVSPSELRDWRGRDRRRRDQQDVEGVEEIVEFYQSQPSAHLYRKQSDDSWTFEAIGGMDGIVPLRSLGLDLPLAEIYEGVDFTESE